MPMPRQPVPALRVPTLAHGEFTLADDAAPNLTLAVSSDGRERAQAMADKLRAPDLRMGYDLALAGAREWGLYISTSRGATSIGIEEPALFSEPGVFLVRPDGTLYYGAVQTMPFARPHFDELLPALDFALAKNYPARGEYTGAV